MEIEQKKMKQNFSNPSFRKIMKKKLGGVCANCGSDKDIQYHHIVPILYGGTNNLSNIVPLCRFCHGKAHGRFSISYGSGRPKTIELKEAESVLKRFFNLEIGTNEAKQLLGGVKKNVWYRLKAEYKTLHHGKYIRNSIDVKASKQNYYENLNARMLEG